MPVTTSQLRHIVPLEFSILLASELWKNAPCPRWETQESKKNPRKIQEKSKKNPLRIPQNDIQSDPSNGLPCLDLPNLDLTWLDPGRPSPETFAYRSATMLHDQRGDKQSETMITKTEGTTTTQTWIRALITIPTYIAAKWNPRTPTTKHLRRACGCPNACNIKHGMCLQKCHG